MVRLRKDVLIRIKCPVTIAPQINLLAQNVIPEVVEMALLIMYVQLGFMYVAPKLKSTFTYFVNLEFNF
ncbi:hypothetical protein ED312_08290 [Sinomicrobium pectinilyticum]|uniref:Uncharacterized protein n=1 Tax=Sinomicrobium pectinilyticum TaxID=1084421 RepID=A0A3N0EKW8_SINP1|nr:hypothetical protein ED312_08290 [Sinomicrobium pectinilyticum]